MYCWTNLSQSLAQSSEPQPIQTEPFVGASYCIPNYDTITRYQISS